MKLFSFLFVFLFLFPLCFGQSQPIPEQDWGYVTVRPLAHMFWWLYGASNVPPTSRSNIPLVMWLQGGPGASSTGFGNFAEIGPLDIYLQPRNHSWVQAANLLFVDNPVGTGYSYVENGGNFSTNEVQIAADLLALFTQFLNKYSSLSNTPFYIFSESYGGKMAASFAKALYDAINAKKISCNFAGVAMGDSWIEPIEFVEAWGPYLYSLSLVDAGGAAQITSIANKTRAALNEGKFDLATQLWGQAESVVEEVSFNVDFYNVNQHDTSSIPRMRKHLLIQLPNDPDADLDKLMNGPIKEKLGIPSGVTWGGQSNSVFSALSVDFMQSVVPTVDYLLASGVKTIVYSGNMDLICCTPGTLRWVSHLKWKGLDQWNRAQRGAIQTKSNPVAGAFKIFSNFHFYYIFGAGHMVPADQPETALTMLRTIIKA